MTAKILVFDIETAPCLGYVWGLWENNLGLSQIHTDWYVMSYAAKWLGQEGVIYNDQRHSTNVEDDKMLLSGIWNLLDEADIVITQNGKKFDVKKLNARFIINGFQPPSSFRHIDTLQIAKSVFGFTSNKLEYMTDKLCKTHKKLKHGKYPGFELWRACLSGDIDAWEEMKEYNVVDVLSLEELYYILAPWDKQHPNLNLYRELTNGVQCRCGSEDMIKKGFHYSNIGKYQRWRCKGCGTEQRGKENLLSKEEREMLLRNIVA